MASLLARLLAILALLGGIALLAWNLAAPPQPAATPLPIDEPFDLIEPPPSPTNPPTPPPADELIVYVSGAVYFPDVYRIPEHGRVKDAVLAAGGLTPDADPDRINLAAPLADAQHIIVPVRSQIPPQASDSPPTPPADEQAAPPASPGGLIDLNRASAEELDTLPGIGPALAARIITFRDTHGPFTSIEQLREVAGIGPALFEKIAPLVDVR